jgi:hypothetical protein
MPGTTDREETTSRRSPTGPSHRDLLDAVRRIRRLARSGDPTALGETLVDLRRDLSEHVRLEAAQIGLLPGATPTVALRGQEEVLDLVDRMLDAADRQDPVDCLLAAVELERRLWRQARLEETLRLHLLAP